MKREAHLVFFLIFIFLLYANYSSYSSDTLLGQNYSGFDNVTKEGMNTTGYAASWRDNKIIEGRFNHNSSSQSNDSKIEYLEVTDYSSEKIKFKLKFSNESLDNLECAVYDFDREHKIDNCDAKEQSGNLNKVFMSIEQNNFENFINMEINLSEPDEKETERYPVLVNPSSALYEHEVNNHPENSLNFLVYGVNMSKNETVSKLDRNLDVFFGKDDFSKIGGYQDFFNWFVVDTERDLCGKEIEGFNGENCPNALSSFRDIITYSDELRNSRTAILLLDKSTMDQDVRSFVANDFAVIADQKSNSKPFTHEMGHVIWGFNDEYGHFPDISPVYRNKFFFPQSSAGSDFKLNKYPNTWQEKEKCKNNLTEYYSSSSNLECSISEGGNGWIIEKQGKPSIMKDETEYRLYPHHAKRIRHLFQNSFYGKNTSIAKPENVLHVNVVEDHNEVYIKNKDRVSGYSPNIADRKGNYRVKGLNENGDVVDSQRFDFFNKNRFEYMNQDEAVITLVKADKISEIKLYKGELLIESILVAE